MKIIDVLRAMWPHGIPLSDYERVAALAGETRAAPAAPLAVNARPGKKAQQRGLGVAKSAQLLALLESGPATADDLAHALSSNYASTLAELHKLKARNLGRFGKRPGKIRWAHPTLRTAEVAP